MVLYCVVQTIWSYCYFPWRQFYVYVSCAYISEIVKMNVVGLLTKICSYFIRYPRHSSQWFDWSCSLRNVGETTTKRYCKVIKYFPYFYFWISDHFLKVSRFLPCGASLIQTSIIRSIDLSGHMFGYQITYITTDWFTYPEIVLYRG